MSPDRVHNARIWIVAEQRPEIQALEDFLQQEGHRTQRSTSSPTEIAKTCREFRPDLVLLDMEELPPAGFDKVARLRRMARLGAFLPILGLLPRDDRTAKSRAFAAGAKDCLTRPIEENEVLQRIDNLLETSPRRPPWALANRAGQREEERLQALDLLARGGLHDLNNLMAPLLWCAEMVQPFVSGPEGSSLLGTLRGAAEAATALVRQLHQLTRGSTGQRESLHLGALIREVIPLISPTFPRSIEIQIAHAEGLSPVWGNSTQLRQVLLNLCLNARDAMPEGGTLRITATNQCHEEEAARTLNARRRNYVVLTVEDSGVGIPPELVGKIFRPFFTTKAPGRGTGLGLAIVNEVVQAHGGLLEVESELGKGTRFLVYLPVPRPLEAPSWQRNPKDTPLAVEKLRDFRPCSEGVTSRS